jgi:hypothetical protein
MCTTIYPEKPHFLKYSKQNCTIDPISPPNTSRRKNLKLSIWVESFYTYLKEKRMGMVLMMSTSPLPENM